MRDSKVLGKNLSLVEQNLARLNDGLNST